MIINQYKSLLMPVTGALILGLNSQAATANDSVFFKFDSLNQSEAIPIAALSDNWDGKLYDGDKAWGLTNLELGFKRDAWQYSVFYREDAMVEFHPDTAEFVYKVKNDLPLDDKSEYVIHIDDNSFAASGLKVAYGNTWKNINWNLGFSYLQAHQLNDGTLNGTVTPTSEDEYDYEYNVDYYYSTDRLFGRDVSAPSGQGYAVDLALHTQINEQWDVRFEVKDLLARIYWKDAPRTIAEGQQGSQTYDPRNYFQPTASGTHSYEDYTQDIPSKAKLSAQYKMADNQLVDVSYNNIGITHFIEANYFYNTASATYGIGYITNLNAVRFNYLRDWFEFSFVSDSFQLTEARVLGINIGIRYDF